MTTVPSRLARLGRTLVTVGLLAFLVRLVDPVRVGKMLVAASLPLLAVVVLLSLADRVLMILKWYPLLRVQVSSVTFTRAARAYLASGVAHYLLPASVGADLVRAMVLGRGRREVVEVGASIVAERVLGMLASAVMAMIAVLLARSQNIPLKVIVPWALVAVGLGLAALVLPLSPWTTRQVSRLTKLRPGSRWLGYIDRFATAYAAYRGQTRTLLTVGLLTLAEQMFPVVFMWVGAHALGLTVGFGAMVVVLTLTMFASRLPLSIGGLGVSEGAQVYLLGLYGVPASEALALALLGRAVEALVNAGPAIVLWRDLGEIRGVRGAPTGAG